jgi:microcystin-dependent protein
VDSIGYQPRRHIVPSGQIVPFAGPVDNIPQGWLWCNGTSLGQDTFASLFQAIGTTWGGVGNLTFNIPDFRNKVLVGAGPLFAFGSSGNLGTSSGSGSQLPSYAVINYMIKT